MYSLSGVGSDLGLERVMLWALVDPVRSVLILDLVSVL